MDGRVIVALLCGGAAPVVPGGAGGASCFANPFTLSPQDLDCADDNDDGDDCAVGPNLPGLPNDAPGGGGHHCCADLSRDKVDGCGPSNCASVRL